MSIKWNELLSSITIALMYFANYNRLFIFTKLNFKKTSLVSFVNVELILSLQMMRRKKGLTNSSLEQFECSSGRYPVQCSLILFFICISK